LSWQLGRVLELSDETSRVKNIMLELSAWPGHQAGQHVDVRLTAEDGYQAQRSYSIASSPEDGVLVLTVERLDDGEVSPYLTDELRAGDELELRGPVGGYFVWERALGGPLLLIAGGSGIVPFRAMLRHRSAVDSDAMVRLLYSSRSWEEVIYRDELLRQRATGVDVQFTLTRAWPDGWTGRRGRIDQAMLDEVAWSQTQRPLTFICGPSGFVEAASASLVRSGHEPRRIKTERFGPSGS
jgi:ferredoxin-NADP reductase